MKIEIKNLSHNKRLSEETQCFACSVYVNGKKVGTAENRGHGGCTMVFFQDRELQREVETYCKGLPPYQSDFGDLKMSLEFQIDLLVEKELELREYRRWCRKKLVFRVKGDPEGEFRTLKVPYTPELAQRVQEKYGDKLDFILNERI